MLISHLLLASWWIVYVAIHSILATSKVKIFFHEKLHIAGATYRVVYNIVAFTGLSALVWLQIVTTSTYFIKTYPLLPILGYLMGGGGLIIMISCIVKYFRQLSGLDKNMTGVLQVNGLHRFVRHPLYTGTFLFLLGLLCFFPLWKNLVAVCIIIGYTVYASRFEEAKLIRQFGQTYINYKNKVPAFLPGTRRF
jgi:protein-S-isoprenylcysteine O-methyltransferase Ste14